MNDIKLPKNIPLFPLPRVLLLPGGILPLNIFEKCYLEMFRNAISKNGIIGMVQPASSQSSQPVPEVYSIGCTGQITHHEEIEDGRLLVTLRGLCRFDIIREHENTRPYRTAEVDYLPSGNILNNEHDTSRRQRLLNAASLYLPPVEEKAQLQPILNASTSELATVLAMHCPFSSAEKQSLLEATDVETRVDRLIELLEQSVLDNWPAEEQTVN